MDIHKLDKALYTYYAAALAPSTHNTYRTAEKRYVNFCKDFALTHSPHQSTFCVIMLPAWLSRIYHNHKNIFIGGVASSDHDGPPQTTHGVYAKASAGHKRNKGPTGQSRKDPSTETPDNAGNITAVEEGLGGEGAQLECHNVMGGLYSRLLCLLQVRRDNYPFRDGL